MRTRIIALVCVAVAAGALLACEAGRANRPSLAVAEQPAVLDTAYFLRQLVDLDRLPVLSDKYVAIQDSSYDRKSRYENGQYLEWDANGDAGQYIRIESDGEAVMADRKGPGVLWRIWSANPQGELRIYLDGAKTPSYRHDFDKLFSGEVKPFIRPFVWQRKLVMGGNNPASNLYFPIPFAKSCKITADKNHRQYFHFGFSMYPEGTKIKTFTAELDPETQKVADDVRSKLQNCGQDPRQVDGMRVIERRTELAPGQEYVVAELDGPATVRQLLAKVKGSGKWLRRAVRLQMTWDGAAAPQVDCPIGDFFGDAWDEAFYSSLPLGIARDLNYCYWRMPFRKSARIVVVNEGKRPAELECKVAVQEGPLPPDTAHFCAKWRRDQVSSVFDYPMLECEGRGRFVGCVLFPHNIIGGWWGEGDEKVHVDGEKFPSFFGTGSEDYFGDAWGIRYFENAYHGCASRSEFPRQSVYRWHICDDIPFTKSFVITIENYAAKHHAKVKNDYSSMAYWYQAPGGSDFFQPTTYADRKPQGMIIGDAIEAEEILVGKPASVKIVGDDDVAEELSRSKGVKVSGPAGTTVSVRIPAPEEGRFTIQAVGAKGMPASDYQVLKDGRPVGDRVRLAQGQNAVDFKLTGKPVSGDRCEFVLDYFILHPYRNFIRRWWVAGPFDNVKDDKWKVVYGPEKEMKFDKNAKFDGRFGQVQWKLLHEPGGVFMGEPGKYFHKDQNDDIILYAYAEVVSPQDQKVVAYAGSDDGIKVWINGKAVHDHHIHRGVEPDQDRFEIDLKEGVNSVMLKIDQGGGPWGFCFRINDPEDKLEYKVPE